ncbi:MAG TPA: cytochrome c3 family protein [Planctomycetota bacterium]|nr:cytochrome c3 family protein [Planctomycetota bacterium]
MTGPLARSGRPLLLQLVLALTLAPPAASAQQVAEESCARNCHRAEATALEASVHASLLGCVDCHGGDPAAVRDKAASHAASAGFRGKPARDAVPEMCGGCHSDPLAMFAYGLPTDQLAHWRTSFHGQAVAKGDLRAAVCTDCHGAHGVVAAGDPTSPTAALNQPATCGRCHSDAALMSSYGIASDVVERFLGSVHGLALEQDRVRGVPTCTSCHGSHGAAPPGVGSIVQICAQCHANTGEWYQRGPHAAAAAMGCAECHLDEPAFRGDGCAACHGSHGIAAATPALYVGTEPGHCGHCHRDDPAAAAVSATILDGTARLESAMDETLKRLGEAKRQGLFLKDEQAYLRESQRALIAVKPIAHALDPEAVAARLEDGIKRQDRTLETLERQRIGLRDRKLFVAGGSVVMLMLAALLAVKLGRVRSLS